MNSLLYLAAAALTLFAAHRVTRFTRAAALVLLLLPLLPVGRALVSGAVYGPVDLAYTVDPLASTPQASRVGPVVNPEVSDVYTEFMPWNDALRRSIARGDWPLWNPYELCGTPLAGAAQVAPYHPITLLGLLIPLAQYFSFAAAMMHLIAAVSAFLLFRDFVESETAALFGAAAWTLSTHVIFFAGTALGNAVSVMPLVLLGARRRSAPILCVSLVLLVLSGHPESALHVVALGVVYFFFELRRPIWPAIRAGLGAGVAALLLSAIFLLPHIEAIGQSAEYLERSHTETQTTSTTAQLAHRLVANFFPFLEGAPGAEEPLHSAEVRHGWLATAYCGSLVIALALFALFRAPSREKWFFLGALVFGLGAGVGAPGVTHLLRLLPGFSIAVNDRMIAFAALGFCALAALAIDTMRRGLPAALLITAVIIAIAATAIPSEVGPDYLRAGLFRAIAPLLLAALAPRRFLIVLLLLQRVGEAGRMQAVVPAEAFYPPFAGLSQLRAAEPFRVVALGSLLPPAISTHYGLEEPRGFQAVTLARYDALIPLWSVRQPIWSNRVDDLRAPFLSLANVRFAIVPAVYAEPEGWMRRGEFGTYAIAENMRVLPRAFVPRTVHFGDRATALRGASSARDFAAEAWIESARRRTVRNGAGTVTLSGIGNRQIVRANMSARGWVVVTNAAWKGWRATLGGTPLPLQFANHTFLAFELPAGRHEVELLYRPRSFVIGAWISALSALAVLLLWLWRRRWARPPIGVVDVRRDHPAPVLSAAQGEDELAEVRR